jgi:hypothetical protein
MRPITNLLVLSLTSVLDFGFLVTPPASIAAEQSFRILDIRACQDPSLGKGCTISWNAAANRTNTVEYADLLNGTWQTLTEFLVDTNAGAMSAVDYPPANITQRFYRVRAPRSDIVLSLVLDRSGSMMANGGVTTLGNAVDTFITYFNDSRDRAALISFASHARVDVAMTQPFKAYIKIAARMLTFDGFTCSDQGLENARQQNDAVPVVPGQPVTKIILFFTDGFANTFQYTFNCGVRNIADDRSLYNPTTGAAAGVGCTIPVTIPSIDGTTTVSTAILPQMNNEAAKRAYAVADQARASGNTIYTIGLGVPADEDFLKPVANDPTGPAYNPSQPSGLSVTATNSTQLQAVFEQIAQQVIAAVQ